MTKEQIRNGIASLNDAATAGMIVDAIIAGEDMESTAALLKKLLELFEGGHPQTKELAIVGKRLVNAIKN